MNQSVVVQSRSGFLQIKLKIQNEKMEPLPDSFFLDWDNLSETELKRLVIQLEKTRNELKSDLKEAGCSIEAARSK
jgi:hypothetical protein